VKRARVERRIYKQENGTYGAYLLVNGKPRNKTVGLKLAEARRQRDLLSAKAHHLRSQRRQVAVDVVERRDPHAPTMAPLPIRNGDSPHGS
jgi:hypothetical protein